MPARHHRTPRRLSSWSVRRATAGDRRSAQRWAAASVPLLITGLVTAAITLGPGSPDVAAAPEPVSAAAPMAAAQLAAPTTVKQGKRQVSVDPAADIGTTDAAVTVKGAGFDNSEDLWVAICQVGGGAPKDLSSCLGGPIPDENATTAWGIVTDKAADVPPGPVSVKWAGDGFAMTLHLAGAADAGADCVGGKCAIYVRSSGTSRNQDVTVPIAFKAPPASVASSPATSSTAETTPITSTSQTTSSSTPTPTTSSSPAPVPTTVAAQSVLLKDVEQGREQVAVFTGFQPGEKVSVSLSGGQAKIADLTADPVGTVRVSWKVPADFPIGGYTLRVEGAKSLRVGEAGFTVIAAPALTTASAQVSTPTTIVASPTSSAQEPSPTPSSEVASSASPQSATSQAASASAIPPVDGAGGTPAKGSGTPWWLWITLAAVLLVGLVVGAVALSRRHRQESDDERARREAELAAASAAEAQRHPQPGPVAPVPPGFDEHPDRPILFSHRDAENYSPPTEVIGDPNAPTQAIGSPGAPPRSGGPASPGTQQFDPFADDNATGGVPPAAPGTQQFDPFADDGTGDGPPRSAGNPDGNNNAGDGGADGGGSDGHSDGDSDGDSDGHSDGDSDGNNQWRPPSP